MFCFSLILSSSFLSSYLLVSGVVARHWLGW